MKKKKHTREIDSINMSEKVQNKEKSPCMYTKSICEEVFSIDRKFLRR